jgi:hypothetical protein
MDLREIGLGGVDFICLRTGTIDVQAVVNVTEACGLLKRC